MNAPFTVLVERLPKVYSVMFLSFLIVTFKKDIIAIVFLCIVFIVYLFLSSPLNIKPKSTRKS